MSALCSAAFASCSFPFDYAEEETLKYICVALLPTSEINPACWERKSSVCWRLGLPGISRQLASGPRNPLALAPHSCGLPRKRATQCELWSSCGSYSLISTARAGKKLLCLCITDILRLPCSCKLRETSSSDTFRAFRLPHSSYPNHRLKEW